MKLLYIFLLLLIAGCSAEINMKLTSPNFQNSGLIPSKYTCDGKNINPELNIENIPKNTKSLTLIVEDPDAPVGTWVHWIVWNIPAITKIKENTIPGIQGSNSGKRISYDGPCPPSGTHRYFFKLYALDVTLNLSEGAAKKEVEASMASHILEKTELIGRYSRE